MPALLSGSALDAAMRGSGMRIGAGVAFSTEGPTSTDLELALVSVAHEALPRDFRLLGVQLAWLEVHHARVNVPRLGRLVGEAADSPLERAWWSAIGVWLGHEDARWRAIAKLYEGERLVLDDAEVTELQIRRHGEDARLVGGPLRVHSKLLRSRASDVEAPELLAAHHPLYFRRLELGANYRADVWAALDAEPDSTPAEIARTVGCAYETARSVAQDWALARRVEEARVST